MATIDTINDEAMPGARAKINGNFTALNVELVAATVAVATKADAAATTAALALKATLASPAFTGAPAAPTAAPGTNSTQLASTAFVAAAVAAGGGGSALTGTPLDELATGSIVTTHRPAAGNYFVNFPSAGTAVEVENIAAGNAGLITTVQMSLEGGAGSFDARLRVYVDQELVPSIDVDLGTLFVSHLDAHTGAGWMYGTDHVQASLVGSNSTSMFTPQNTQVSYQLQFPIPYSNGVRIEIYTPVGVTPSSPGALFCSVFHRAGVTSNLRLRSQAATRFDANAGSAYLAANDVAMFDIPNNAGWVVWLSTAIFGATNYTFLERPWKWFVDGEVTESFIFTGGEELGASGWYFGANSRAQTPGILLTASNNVSVTAVFAADILKMHGGVKFLNELKLIWSNKVGFPSTTNHKFGWCVLYYVDTTVAFAPTAPRSVSSIAANVSGTVNWVAPASIGSQKITGYTVTLSPGGATASVAANVLTTNFTGLTNGTPYTPTVVATNSVGNSTGATGSAFTPSAGGPSISDDFNRADASTLGTTPVGAKVWASFFAASGGGTLDIGISSNRAFARSSGGAGNSYPYVATNSADIDESITLAVIGSDPVYAGLIARVVDANNFVVLQYDSDVAGATQYSAYKKIAGVFTLLGSTTAITPTAGDVLRLVVTGTNTVDFYIGATHFGPFTATGISASSVNAGFTSGTGVAVVPSTARFDDFSVV